MITKKQLYISGSIASLAFLIFVLAVRTKIQPNDSGTNNKEILAKNASEVREESTSPERVIPSEPTRKFEANLSDRRKTRRASDLAFEIGSEKSAKLLFDHLSDLKEILANQKDQSSAWLGFVEGLRGSGDWKQVLQKLAAVADLGGESTVGDFELNKGRNLWMEIIFEGFNMIPLDQTDDARKIIPATASSKTRELFEHTLSVHEMCTLSPEGRYEQLQVLPTEQRAIAETRYLSSLALTNPELAGNYFLSEQCVSKPTVSQTREILAKWVQQDTMGASQLIRDSQISPQRDYAIAYLAKFIVSDNPEAALKWYSEIKDPVAKNDCLKYLKTLKVTPP